MKSSSHEKPRVPPPNSAFTALRRPSSSAPRRRLQGTGEAAQPSTRGRGAGRGRGARGRDSPLIGGGDEEGVGTRVAVVADLHDELGDAHADVVQQPQQRVVVGGVCGDTGTSGSCPAGPRLAHPPWEGAGVSRTWEGHQHVAVLRGHRLHPCLVGHQVAPGLQKPLPEKLVWGRAAGGSGAPRSSPPYKSHALGDPAPTQTTIAGRARTLATLGQRVLAAAWSWARFLPPKHGRGN
jgi:hypothetical protein